MSEVTKCKHGRNFCLECHQAGSELDTALSQLAASLAANESLSAELAWSENDSRDQSKEIAALREELADMQRWRDLALQFDHHRMSALWHLKTLVLNPGYSPAVTDFLAEPPLPAHEVVQRLADAERRNGVLFDLLDTMDKARWSYPLPKAFQAQITAALNKPEEAKS